MKLRDQGEGGLIRRIQQRFGRESGPLTVGIGDDAAVINIPTGFAVVFCSDLLAENTHFIRSLHPPDSIGYKAVAANVSDIAAMGGVAAQFLISLAAPADLDWTWLERFFDGVEYACRRFGLQLAGGDSASSDLLFIDVAMIGRVRPGEAVRRCGARPGDGIYVTGKLGSSALGLERLRAGEINDPAVKRHLFPDARHRIGPAIARQAHAMIDVSDGLSTDLTHLLTESKVSARIYKHLLPAWPGAGDLHVLNGGEEYELIIAAPDLPDMIEDIPVTRIGEIIESNVEHRAFLVEGNHESVLEPHGWRHFQSHL